MNSLRRILSLISPMMLRVSTSFGKKILSFVIIAALASINLFHLRELRVQAVTPPPQSRGWQMGKQVIRRQRAVPALSSKVSPLTVSMLRTRTNAKSQGKSFAIAEQEGTTYGILNTEFESKEARERFAVKGVTVFNSYDRFADMFVPLNPKIEKTLRAIGLVKGLKYFEFDGEVTVPPPPRAEIPKQRGQQEAEKIIRGGLDGLTGKGVIIAIVDSGVDFRNPDFITYDAEGKPVSRLLYLWDTTSDAFDTKKLGSKPPLSYPNKASLGTLYTQQQLTAELRAQTPQIPATDLAGHGTACASVAAGNGNNGKGKDYVKGVAPEADIIAIRAGGEALANGEAGEGINNAWLLNALCGWLETVAGQQPLVVSCSFGGHYGGHDGQHVSERQLDVRFSPEKKSRALVIAAGNEGDFPIHAEAQFKKRDAAGLITWASDQPVRITFYFDTPHFKDIQIMPAIKASQANKKIATIVVAEGINPITEKYEMQVISAEKEAKKEGDIFESGLFLFNSSGKPMKVDAYIEGGAFVEGMSAAYLVGSPGVVKNAITVGSYDWNDLFDRQDQLVSYPSFCDKQTPLVIGGLSCYSSPGFSRNGTVKPDIVAPGEIYHASYAKHLNGKGVYDGKGHPIDSTGNYMLFNGTSAATPYTAGVIALMFQQKPQLSVGELKGLLQQHATSNHLTGKVPNNWWGYGKLDLAAIRRLLQAIKP
ncbi:MAG: S8 family serine peptidase [Acidobacteria bacterium]|nr:S8 family serine peptidase [Acidobacteriota bacterium]